MHRPLSSAAGPDPQKTVEVSRQWWALCIGAFPFYGLSLIRGLLVVEDDFSSRGFVRPLYSIVLYWLIFGVPLLLALRYVCRERLRSLQPGVGSVASDAVHSVYLYSLLWIAGWIANIVTALFGLSDSHALNSMAKAIHDDMALCLCMLGPYAWLAGGLFEELVRVFLLTRLTIIQPGRRWRALRITIAALLFGLAHSYQGAAGFVNAFAMGAVLAGYFELRGRFWPMVIAHGALDTTLTLLMVKYSGLY